MSVEKGMFPFELKIKATLLKNIYIFFLPIVDAMVYIKVRYKQSDKILAIIAKMSQSQ